MNFKITRIMWIIFGFISLGLGTIGIILPFLPTVPLYMFTAYCFAKSSNRLHNWFVSTALYKKYLKDFVCKKAMTVKNKLTVMGTVTIVMGIGFVMMDQVIAGRICLGVVWVFHVLYFIFRIGTIPSAKEGAGDAL